MDISAATLSSSVVQHQSASSLIAIRLAAESQRQMADLLAQSTVSSAGNPEHLGQKIDTYA